MALSARLKGLSYTVYVMMGDGELQEGMVWEAAMCAAHHKVTNLIAIVDCNNLQINGTVDEIMCIQPLPEKWRAFGWQVVECDNSKTHTRAFCKRRLNLHRWIFRMKTEWPRTGSTLISPRCSRALKKSAIKIIWFLNFTPLPRMRFNVLTKAIGGRTMSFSRGLKAKAAKVWEDGYNHPFVQELGMGTLDKEKFKFYLLQDYLYLLQYAKVFAIAAIKSDTEELMTNFSKVQYFILANEMDLHREYMAGFGINPADVANVKASFYNRTYTANMLEIGQTGGLAFFAGILFQYGLDVAAGGYIALGLPATSRVEHFLPAIAA